MPDFFDISALISLALAAAVLLRLAVIDLKTLLLPNTHVLAFAMLAPVFHFFTAFEYIDWQSALIGALIGGGLLLVIRTVGNYFYNQDTLGLGDVKLMAAAGLWLGQDYILHALIIGAVAGLVHGIILILAQWATTKKLNGLSTFSLPAGPGFIVGIAAAMVAKFFMAEHLLF